MSFIDHNLREKWIDLRKSKTTTWYRQAILHYNRQIHFSSGNVSFCDIFVCLLHFSHFSYTTPIVLQKLDLLPKFSAREDAKVFSRPY